MPRDIVYVPVPKDLLQSTYEWLAEAMQDSASPVAVAAQIEPAVLDEGMLRRIYEDSLEPYRRLMELMATRPGEWRYSNEIAADLGLEHGARGLAGMLGAYGRRAKHRYGGLKPWESKWDPAREEMLYMMPADVADTVRELSRTAR